MRGLQRLFGIAGKEEGRAPDWTRRSAATTAFVSHWRSQGVMHESDEDQTVSEPGSKTLLRINEALLFISRRLFAYQICIRARALPDARHLLKETIASSSALRAQVLQHVA